MLHSVVFMLVCKQNGSGLVTCPAMIIPDVGRRGCAVVLSVDITAVECWQFTIVKCVFLYSICCVVPGDCVLWLYGHHNRKE